MLSKILRSLTISMHILQFFQKFEKFTRMFSQNLAKNKEKLRSVNLCRRGRRTPEAGEITKA